MNYNNPVPEYADLMTVEDFKNCVEVGGFKDYDGFGFPVKDGKEDDDLFILPSRLHEIPEDATHIAWYSK